MDLSTLQAKVLEYGITEILPSLPAGAIRIGGFSIPLSQSLMQFGAGVGIAMSSFQLERFAPQLQMFGILDEANEVDPVKLTEAMRAEIAKVKTIKVGDFEFDAADVDKFADYLNS